MTTIDLEPKAAEKKVHIPSTVKLTSFAIYKTHGHGKNKTVEIIHGAKNSRINDQGVVELVAGSAPFRSNSFAGREPAPGFGLLALYGTRDTIDELHHWRTHAREIGAQFASAEIEYVINTIEVGLVSRELLAKSWKSNGSKIGFLNLRRATSEFQSDVLDDFQEWNKTAKNADSKSAMNKSRMAEIASYPNLFNKLLHGGDAELSRLSVLVIPVADDPAVPGRMRQMAYIKPRTVVKSIVQSSTAASILLPEWMGEAKSARALAKSLQEENK